MYIYRVYMDRLTADRRRMADRRRTDGGWTANNGGTANRRRTESGQTADGGWTADRQQTAERFVQATFPFLSDVS